MKYSTIIFSLFTIGIVTNGCNNNGKEDSKQSELSVKEDFFLGQKPPGLKPELFASGTVSTENLEMPSVIDAKENKFYFIRKLKGEVPKTHVFHNENGDWQDSVLTDHFGGFIDPDGNTLYQGSEYRERTATGWSEKKSLEPLYSEFPIMGLTVSSEKTYVFDDHDSIGTIYYSRIVDGRREVPKAFGKEINTGKWTAHPFIAPDESYIIWDSEREGGYGETDLYISFSKNDGSWGDAINMGEEINSEYEDGGGYVTNDGKYFFFNRINLTGSFETSEANIFWVDAQVIENLKSKIDDD